MFSSHGKPIPIAIATSPHTRCSPVRSTRSASQPSGSWNSMSPANTTVTISAATPTAKPWLLAYTGSSDSTTASKNEKNSTATHNAGATRKKPARPKLLSPSSCSTWSLGTVSTMHSNARP
ncbi:hypothetical protein D9M71_485630 [compost metagenome]